MSEEVQRIYVPEAWYMGAHGDPIAQFNKQNPLVLVLHEDGTVTWERDEP